MVKNTYMCGFCGIELEKFYDICPHCGNKNCVGYVDSIGGWHEAGVGIMPDGTCCGECSNIDCGTCGVWQRRLNQKRTYGTWKCEECGHELEIWLDQLEEEKPAEEDGFKYERRHLMWHCTECGCDYENYWETQFGDTSISKPQRKFWG